MGLNDKLKPAPRWLCVISLLWYVVLWARGVRHTIAAYHYNSSSSNDGTDGFGGDSHSAPDDSSPEFGLRRDVGQLCALYALESVLAMGWGLSTLANWRLVDFLLHHVPYALVVGTALIYEVNNDVMRAYRYTLPLTLLTSANEAATIGFGLGLSRALDRPNRLYLLLLMLALLVAECFESYVLLAGSRHHTSSNPRLGLQLVALLQLGAPLYHAFGVIPCCWKRLRSRDALLSGSFDGSGSSEGSGEGSNGNRSSAQGTKKE